MYFLIPNAVSFDKSVHVLAVIAVITQRVKDLSERDMWQVFGNVFRLYANPPEFNNRPNSCLRLPDYGFAMKFSIRNNVWVLCCLDHLLPFCCAPHYTSDIPATRFRCRRRLPRSL